MPSFLIFCSFWWLGAGVGGLPSIITNASPIRTSFIFSSIVFSSVYICSSEDLGDGGSFFLSSYDGYKSHSYFSLVHLTYLPPLIFAQQTITALAVAGIECFSLINILTHIQTLGFTVQKEYVPSRSLSTSVSICTESILRPLSCWANS